MKEFNVTGTCFPQMHYMADTSEKINQIVNKIDAGRYFTINRARQYGKTTTLRLLRNELASEYLVISISFQGTDDIFLNNERFISGFQEIVMDALRLTDVSSEILDGWKIEKEHISLLDLSRQITWLCKQSAKKIVLLIDEVDRSSNNQVFLNFLGMLREKYLNRDVAPTFHSVILAGVYDIKNLKLRLRPDEERKFNLPWNIAAKFDVDMSLNSTEIISMLTEYEADHQTGMNITEIAEAIHDYTSGYPFLISRICLEIHESIDITWSYDGVVEAIKAILMERNTLFDDISKNLENNKNLYDFMHALLIQGKTIRYTPGNPVIDVASMYGFIRNVDGRVFIHNKIFEVRMIDYFISKEDTTFTRITNQFIEEVTREGVFDMALCMDKFSEYYTRVYNEKDIQFIERQCRLLFLIYIQPLLNGVGGYFIESQTSDESKMDIVVYYKNQYYIIELKLWYGDKRHHQAYDQLLRYMDKQNEATGYLLTFDFRKHKEPRAEWIDLDGKRIYDCIV